MSTPTIPQPPHLVPPQLVEMYYERVSAGDWTGAIMLCGRNAGPELLWWWSHLWRNEDRGPSGLGPDRDTLGEIIIDAWSGAEWPLSQLDADRWATLFAESGFVTDCDAEPPVGPIRLRRGAADRCRAGWSWTDDLSVAPGARDHQQPAPR